MGLKTFTIDFAEFAKHQYLRFDEKFWFTIKNLVTYDYILLEDIFNLRNGNSYTEYYTNEETKIPYIRIRDLTFRFEIDDKSLVYLDDSVELNKEKILKEDDLILATIGATIGKVNLAREFKGGTFSNNTILLRFKNKENHNPYFYEKLFQTNLLQKYIWGVVSQKAQPNLQTYDLLKIKIPLISKQKQDQIVAEIEPIEKKIKKLKNQITPSQEIINKVFAREFGFDLEKFEKLKTEKFFDAKFFSISNFPSLRSGVKNYKNNYKYLFEFFKNIPTINLSKIFGYIRNSVASELDSEGNNKVVKIAQLKNGYIDYENCENISDEFFEKNKKQLKIREKDIFIVNRGVGSIGKVDLCEKEPDEDYLIGGSIYILRELYKNFSHPFITYFLRSALGYYQMEFGFFGNTNQIALYLPILNNIQIPDIPLKSQQKIVDEIKAELDKQEEMKKKIETQRNKIDEIIEKIIL